jgi:hypothetical protein
VSLHPISTKLEKENSPTLPRIYAKEIDGSILTLKDNQIGIFPGAPAVQFYTAPTDERPGTVELHKYPVAGSDQVLAFIGNNELLDFFVINPITVPKGTTYDWKSFSLVSKSQGAGKPDNLVTYASKNGGNWVAFQTGSDGWAINWRGGMLLSFAGLRVIVSLTLIVSCR